MLLFLFFLLFLFIFFFFFFFNDTATTEIYTLSLHDALPILGTARYPLSAFSIESRVTQGFAWSSWLPALVVLLSIAGIAIGTRSRPPERPAPRFAQYLVLVGLFSIAGYLFGRCGEVNFYAMRYELLSVLGIVGLAGWFLSAGPPKALQAAWMTALAA